MVRYNQLVLGLLLVGGISADTSQYARRTKKENKHKKKGKPNKPSRPVALPVVQTVIASDSRMSTDEADPMIMSLLGNANGIEAMTDFLNRKQTIGSITSLIPEASDASFLVDPEVALTDGGNGDIDFPHGNMKPIATVGEYDAETGAMIVGVPDGLGAMLSSDDHVRVIVQSESYLPSFSSRPEQLGESYPFIVNKDVDFVVNNGSAGFTGSHVQYVDYDREGLLGFLDGDEPASSFVVGSGNLIEKSYNLKGELVGPRSREGPTTFGAHYGNCDADGNWVVKGKPVYADWVMQSLCSASLSEKYMWGEGIGFEDDVYITNEEWMTLEEDTTAYVGLSAHVIDIDTKTDYAIGAFTNTGFEKIVEINPMSEEYIIVSLSGYNGAYSNMDLMVDNRNEWYGNRTDGKPWVKAEHVHPARIYVGKKGFKEDGTPAPAEDFLAKNGLRYGKVYGFATDMTESGPSGGKWRDDFHRDAEMAFNGAQVPGFFMPIDWQWNGTVTDFIHDGAWDFQEAVPGAPEGYEFWNGLGNDKSGCKTEHNSPIQMEGISGFVQTSTCGYFGEYILDGLVDALEGLEGNELPGAIGSTYVVYQGELDIRSQIHLGGKGQYANGGNATSNYSGSSNKKTDTFEDIDGFEEIIGVGGKRYAIIQEDSGNRYGERMFITELHHDGPLDYYFVAQSGGDLSTRTAAGVGVPAGTNQPSRYGTSAHEFSGVCDLSGFLTKDDDGEFVLKYEDSGHAMIAEKASVHINDKNIVVNLQAHNLFAGPFDFFDSDRGGQWLLYKPDVDAF